MGKKSKKDTDIVECENIATVQNEVIDHMLCENCNDDYLFKMKDNYHEFFIPLRTIFGCLLLGDEMGIIPPLPSDWKCDMVNSLRYG